MIERSREQKLVDMMYEIAMCSAEYMHGKTAEEIAAWVTRQLDGQGFVLFPWAPAGACFRRRSR